MLSFKGVAKRTGIWTGMAPFLTMNLGLQNSQPKKQTLGEDL